MSAGKSADRPNVARVMSMPLVAVEVLVFLAVLVVIYVFLGTDPSQLTTATLFRLSWVNNVLLLVQILILRRSFGSLTAPAVLYAVFLSLFTSGQLILFSLGVDPSGADVLNREAHYAVGRATAFYLTAFTLFCAGCLLTNEVKRIRPTKERAKTAAKRTRPALRDWQRSLLSVGVACIAVGVVPFAVSNYHNFRVILSQGYSGYYVEGARIDSPLVSLSYLFITGLVFVGSSGRARYRDGAAVALVVVALVRLAAGDRGEGMIYLLSGYLVHTLFARPGKGRRLIPVLLLAFALIVIPAVGILRQSFGGDATGSGLGLQAENPFESTLGTMGATLFPLVSVMKLVPGTVQFASGATYLSSFTHLLPSFLRAGPLANLAVDPVYSSPATWLQNDLGLSYGPGFTPFAEAYMNFGWWLGCLAMFFYGVLFTLLLRVPSKASNSWPLRMALVLTTFALLGFTVRGSFNLTVPFLFRYVFLPGVPVVLFAHRFRGKRKAPREEPREVPNVL